MRSDIKSTVNNFTESFSLDIKGTNLYNNEMIGALSIYFVMSKFSSMEASKSLLILPLSTHNTLISYLNDSRTKVKGLEQLIIKKPEFFSNFNQRYYSLMELSMNSILILIKLDLVSISKDGQLKPNTFNPLFDDSKRSLLGFRGNKIIQASSAIADLLSEDVQNLYLQLRVEL
jgi:hypothetical protein